MNSPPSPNPSSLTGSQHTKRMRGEAAHSNSYLPIGHISVTDRQEERTYPAQCDQRTCGIAALAAASARAAKRQRTQDDGERQTTGSLGQATDEATRRPFAHYETLGPTRVERVQKDAHRLAARTGFPWPRALGTSPWALAALASRATGIRYIVRPWTSTIAARVAMSNASGHDVFIYVGERIIPRHVVLMLGDDLTARSLLSPELSCDPASSDCQTQPASSSSASDRQSQPGPPLSPSQHGSGRGGEKTAGTVRIFEPSIGHVFVTDRHEIPLKWEGTSRKAHWGWWTRPLLAVLPAFDGATPPGTLPASGGETPPGTLPVADPATEFCCLATAGKEQHPTPSQLQPSPAEPAPS